MSITSVANDLVTSVSVINALKPLPPTISGYSVGGVDDTALDPAGGQTVQINGTGFLAGATITFDGSAVAVVTYVNPNQLTFTSPAKSAGTYTIYVVNADGGTAIYIPGIIYSVLPTWTTSAGTLGSYYETTSISNTVIASGDAPITYSLFSGSLPTGSTLYANGVITGTAPVDSSSTTYSFTIEAIDAQLQGSTRSFSLTINVDAVTWVTPANATTYTNAVDSVIANVALSATDAAGYAVSYSANALPTGLTLTGSNIAGTPTVIADSSTLLTATAATTNRSATRTINWSITVANDVYFEYNTLLIPGASTTFVDDASTNNFAVSIFGDTKPNNFNPYTPGYYSNYFNGSSAIVNRSNNTALAMGTGDFTIEFWMNSSSAAAQVIYDSRLLSNANSGGINIYQNGGILYLYGGANTDVLLVSASITYNQWNHIAFVKSGSSAGNVKMYVNGVLSSTYGSADTSNYSLGYLAIATFYNLTPDAFYTGYLSNFRIVKGTAVYTLNFTPSTTPLTAIANTSLLTCQSNRFIDNSTNAFAITTSGSPTINSFDPFTPNTSYSLYGSGYFDGTGDYLTVPANSAFDLGTGNFTIECWFYYASTPPAAAGYDYLWGLGSTGVNGLGLYIQGAVPKIWNGSSILSTSGAISATTWYHIAVVKNSSTLTVYLNGTSIGSVAFSSNLSGGGSSGFNIARWSNFPDPEEFPGYISDVRIVKGTAVYTTTFTPPSAPLTAIANTSLLTLQNNQSVNNSVFLDNSTNNFLVTRNGNTTQGTFSPYGANWSNYFDGSSYLSIPDSASLELGSSNFTLECWVNFSSLPATNGTQATFFSKWDASQSSYVFYLYNDAGTYKLYFTYSTSGSNATDVGNITWNPTVGVTYHLALVRSGSNLLFFVNGTQQGATQTLSATVYNSTAVVTIGVFTTVSPSGPFFNGYISNARQVIGTAVYTTTFTPSTTPLTPITNTVLLTCQSNRLIDNSINNFTITKNGDVSVQRFSPFNPSSLTPTSYSGYFDGTGDYLNAPSNAVFGFGTGDFTIEGWFYFTGTIGTYQRPWWFGDDNDNIEINGSVLRVGGASQGTLITGGTTIVASTWYHIALTRASGSYKLWLNGSQQGSTATNSYNSSARTFTAMATSGGANPSTGYVSNLRIVKGTAVYTTTFTPSTTPLTAISGTSLLTLQSTTFIDNSTNNFTITAAGNSQPTQQNPFGYTSAATQGYTASTIGGSGYFNGSGYSNLVLPSNASLAMGTGNFTIEFWINTSNIAQTGYVLQTDTSPNTLYISLSGSTIRLTNQSTPFAVTPTLLSNTWYHIAVVRSGTSSVIYTNGVAGTAVTCSIDFTQNGPSIGNNSFIGYLSDCRIVKGTAVYTSNFVPPSAPLTAIQNTVLLTNMTSAGIYDAAMMNNMETVGDAKLSTAVSKFGGTSMSFDGTGDYLVVGNPAINPNLNLGAGDFTIEAWVYPIGTSPYLIIGSLRNTTGVGCYWLVVNGTFSGGGTIQFGYNTTASGSGTNVLAGSGTLSTSTWSHIAVTRSGANIRCFVNGTQVGTTNTGIGSSAIYPVNQNIYIGQTVDGAGYNMNGYIDDLRITKGFARYTANFSAPTSAFPIY